MINGVTQLVMTKADILDGLSELKVCESYHVDGKEKKYSTKNTIPSAIPLASHGENHFSVESGVFFLYIESKLRIALLSAKFR